MKGMEKMLETASKKLGISSNELGSLLKKGDMNAIMEKMDKDEAKKLKDALNNPEVVKMMKNSTEMSDYMKNMQENQKK
ncbi:MAG: hypothetical protein FWH07_02840 [Oscillospiraceae bacterium]|nr:hypothetical protein [Oscillospiraceae bacterium]